MEIEQIGVGHDIRPYFLDNVARMPHINLFFWMIPILKIGKHHRKKKRLDFGLI